MNKPSPIRKDCSAWKRAEGSNTRSIAILAGLIVVLILVVGTIWNGRSASRDTEQAVRSVSLLYLDELAGRREQVVSSNLDNNIEKMNAALSLLTDEDLSDAAHLQAFQARMKKLYHLEKFAFVDADGLIGSISRGIIVRSVVQTALTILALSAMTVMIISQLRRNARLVLEKETGEAESRVKCQELEEKLALQEALLAREARDDQQRKLITALAADYWSVYYIELDRDEGVCYQAHEDVDDGFRPGDRFRYLESVTAYANQYITEPYRDEFMRFTSPRRSARV